MPVLFTLPAVSMVERSGVEWIENPPVIPTGVTRSVTKRRDLLNSPRSGSTFEVGHSMLDV